MESLETTRGVGRELELFGIRSSYILVIAAGIAVGVLLHFMLSVTGAGASVSISAATIWCTSVTAGTIAANKKLGRNGLTKRIAGNRIPRGIRMGMRCFNLVRHNAKKI